MTSPFSSFDGLIPEIPGISVDNFERTDCHAYFLSHCHTDHTQGLSSLSLMRHLEDQNVRIYMSDMTAEIIGAIPCYDGVKKYFKPLKLESPTTIKLPAAYDEFYLEVTLVPAAHCTGSIMFLFRTTLHTVLFTGDFRISHNDVSKLGPLHKDEEPISIDKMYVDTTFIDCDYDNFPKRSESTESVIKVIKEWLDRDPGNCVALHPSARFGYEYVFNEIFKRLKLKVAVHEGDWAIYSKFPDKVNGVTDQRTRIHKCSNRTERYPHSLCATINSEHLFVHLSAMKWANYQMDHVPFTRTERRVDICFATHSSRSELINFVSYFNPNGVVGFPKPYVIGDVRKTDKVVFKQRKRKMIGGRGGKVKK